MPKTTFIVGGGFYGCCLALLCKSAGHDVTIIEAEKDLLCRASYANQARVHYGYHYPRNFLTAFRSALNFPRFVSDFRPAISDSFTKLYAIARRNSKVTADQFYRFAKKINAPISLAPRIHQDIFDKDLIEQVFSVTEYAFDAAVLRTILRDKLLKAHVKINVSSQVTSIENDSGKGLHIVTKNGENYQADQVYVACYARINTLLKDSGLPLLPMKHEITEIALVQHQPPLDSMGITVMDGPFFSTMPFPARDLHSFTHVRYTPHSSWTDSETAQDPYRILQDTKHESTWPLMKNDAIRYLPGVKNTDHVQSLFEIKTVLLQNEENDGRPILLRQDYGGMKGLNVVMGGKIDNIYDILSALGELREAATRNGNSWITKLLRGE